MNVSLEIENRDKLLHKATISPSRVYNLGSATRQIADARPHQDEVADAGVAIALDIPAPRVYPISPHNLTTGDELLVHNSQTSGEVEIVLLATEGQTFIGVGSDHTDRALEKTSILWSKQAYPNVLAPRFWYLEDLRDHWDQLILRSWVDSQLYQEFQTKIFLPPDELLTCLAERVGILPASFLLFSGTYVSIEKSLGFGKNWEFELSDPVLGRNIRHKYTTTNILEEIHEEHRVPLERSTD